MGRCKAGEGVPLSGLRILVLGYVVRGPLGGMAWHHLQYALGLAQLGHEVTFVEDSDDYPSCYDPSAHTTGTDPGYGLRFAARAFEGVGLGERWAYYDAHTARWHGPRADHIGEVCAGAELLLNLSGVNPLRPWLQEVPVRALVDTDPAFTQIRHLSDAAAQARAAQHTAFFTFGENAGQAGCGIPDDGFPWRPTRQPVVLDAWPVTPGRAGGRFTTVMQWESYPARVYGGARFGVKSEAFLPYLELPKRTSASLELAVGSPSAPRDRLRAEGWAVVDPLAVTADLWTYQRYIRQSKAEFSVAKHGYAASHSGWFSERSTAYLASGRPTVILDTGFSTWLETGQGVLPFNTPDGALAAIEEVSRSYTAHCRAAREVARAFFDARDVLPRLIEAALAPEPARRP